VAAPQHANARPATAVDAGPVLKLHRRVMRLQGRDHTVLTLRPAARARFSTNYFHDTWHILSDVHGANVLARLLRGLSYQARPDTVVLIDPSRLDPNPFDAEPAHPIALVPAGLTAYNGSVLRELRHRLDRSPTVGTVRWHTHGLDLRVAEQAQREATLAPGVPRHAPRYQGNFERVRLVGGVLAVVAARESLRDLAVDMSTMARWWYGGQSYLEIDGRDGELQIWQDYHRMVSVARQARAEVLARPDSDGTSQDLLRARVWRHAVQVRRRRYGLPGSPARRP
jgi:hypothetical protein